MNVEWTPNHYEIVTKVPDSSSHVPWEAHPGKTSNFNIQASENLQAPNCRRHLTRFRFITASQPNPKAGSFHQIAYPAHSAFFSPILQYVDRNIGDRKMEKVVVRVLQRGLLIQLPGARRGLQWTGDPEHHL
jgi:hypothetical protein